MPKISKSNLKAFVSAHKPEFIAVGVVLTTALVLAPFAVKAHYDRKILFEVSPTQMELMRTEGGGVLFVVGHQDFMLRPIPCPL